MKLRELFDIIYEQQLSYLPFEEVLAIIKNPQFDDICRVHCWKNYISEREMSNWGRLPTEVKLVLFFNAEKRADDEEWD